MFSAMMELDFAFNAISETQLEEYALLSILTVLLIVLVIVWPAQLDLL